MEEAVSARCLGRYATRHVAQRAREPSCPAASAIRRAARGMANAKSVDRDGRPEVGSSAIPWIGHTRCLTVAARDPAPSATWARGSPAHRAGGDAGPAPGRNHKQRRRPLSHPRATLSSMDPEARISAFIAAAAALPAERKRAILDRMGPVEPWEEPEGSDVCSRPDPAAEARRAGFRKRRMKAAPFTGKSIPETTPAAS